VTGSLRSAFRFAIVLLVISLGCSQALGDEIDIALAVLMPEGNFFWNACRT
jgi:hypothetical protein